MVTTKNESLVDRKSEKAEQKTIEVSFRTKLPEEAEIIASSGPSNHYKTHRTHPNNCCVCSTDIV